MSSLSGKRHPSSAVETPETTQEAVWKGGFGREYTVRNTYEPAALDELYRKNYGLTRTELNQSFLRGLEKEASFLEVGCNTGNQLLLLQQMGWTNLSGIELQPYAVEIARARLPQVSLEMGSALTLPYADASFDVVFTSGVLIHIAPTDLPRVVDEIHRVSCEYIWGLEYYSPELTEVSYRNHSDLLWKTDFARFCLDRFHDLELVREQRLPYLENQNVDAAFLLRKKRQPL